MALLESSYRERNHADFTRILANAPDQGVGFVFFVATLPPGSLWWDFDEESRIHRRMFGRGDFEPGEQEVPPQFWLDAINISLHRVTEWTERPELYRSATNPNGLPPEKWKVIDARFSTFVFFDTQTDQDFLVEGEAIFTVIEDLEKSGAEPGHFLLLQWQDVDPNGQHEKEAKTWSVIKYLYK